VATETKAATATEQRLFNVKDAVLYLRSLGAADVTLTFVRTIVATGQVPHIQMGKTFYVSRAALDEWIERHERRAR
jgi:excisionase family DNA binding protein